MKGQSPCRWEGLGLHQGGPCGRKGQNLEVHMVWGHGLPEASHSSYPACGDVTRKSVMRGEECPRPGGQSQLSFPSCPSDERG